MAAVHDVEVIEDPAAAAVALDPMRARLLAELAEPGSAGALAAAHRHPPPEAQLPPAGARGPRPGRADRGAQAGRHHRAGAAGHGRQLRRVARRAQRVGRRPRTGRRPAVGPLHDRPGRPPRPRGRQPGPPGRGRRQAPADHGHRHRDPLPLRRRPRRLRRRAHRTPCSTSQRATTTTTGGRTGSSSPPIPNPRSPHDHARRPPPPRAHLRGAGHARAGVGRHRHRRRHQLLVHAAPTSRSARAAPSSSTWARTARPRAPSPAGSRPSASPTRSPTGPASSGHDDADVIAAGHRVPRRGAVRRHVRGARREQRLRHRRRLGAGVLRRDGAHVDAVLRPPPPLPHPLPRPAGHAARGRTSTCPATPAPSFAGALRRALGADAVGQTDRRPRPHRLRSSGSTTSRCWCGSPTRCRACVAFVAFGTGPDVASRRRPGLPLLRRRARLRRARAAPELQAWLESTSALAPRGGAKVVTS